MDVVYDKLGQFMTTWCLARYPLALFPPYSLSTGAVEYADCTSAEE